MTAYVHAITDFIAQHPHWAGLLVFLTAAIEAIAVIGALVPGSTILVGIGTVVGLGHLPLWPILIWAVLGAIVGDGVSYWLGHRYGHHIVQIWPFSRRPELFDQGEAFFRRHGAKSVVLGRFLPMTRAVVPVVAGVLGMRPSRFYVANVLSAIVWAPLHILPGVAFGGFLSVVGGISGRLVAVLLGALLLVLAVAWLLRLAVLRAVPLIGRLQVWAFSWAGARPGPLARLVAGALDPAHPGAQTVLLLGVAGAACGIGFVDILYDVLAKDALVQADSAISNFVQGFRTGWADQVMVGVTMLGDTVVTAAVAIATAAWLAWQRQWRLAAGFVLTLVLAAVSVTVLKATLQMPRPIDIFSGSESFSFPSGHATLSAALYGMLAWLISISLTGPWRVAPLAVAGGFVGLIAASRIYLAAHWPSDVGAGIFLGFGFATIFGLVYRRAEARWPRHIPLLPIVLAVLVGVGGWHIGHGFNADLKIYARRGHVTVMAEHAWRDGGWRQLPQRRIDLGGETEEPFALQWAGTADQLRTHLAAASWTAPVAWSLRSAVDFASSTAKIAALPALPLLHDGRTAELTLVAPQGETAARLVLRAWPSGYAVETAGGRRPLLLVSVLRERFTRPWNLATVPLDRPVPSGRAEQLLTAALSGRASWSSPKPGLLIARP